jgi:hypothetical protein
MSRRDGPRSLVIARALRRLVIPWASRAIAMLPVLLGLSGCSGWPIGISLPGGPTRGTMTYDEAVAARDGLTRLDRVPQDRVMQDRLMQDRAPAR